MVLLDELRVTMSDYQKDMDELYEVLGVAAATERYNVLQEEIAKEGFWDDLEHSQKVLQESKTLENRINSYKKMQSELEDIITLIELSIEEGETESTPDMNAECDAFIKKLEEMKLASLLTGEYDHSNAILTFHAGAGGTEAQDWAEMLYRMYNRWAERHHFKVTTLDYLDGDEAGLKSASILIEGENAYGFLKSESGVHRLVRVSPFDASGRRHTSFSAAVRRRRCRLNRCLCFALLWPFCLCRRQDRSSPSRFPWWTVFSCFVLRRQICLCLSCRLCFWCRPSCQAVPCLRLSCRRTFFRQ